MNEPAYAAIKNYLLKLIGEHKAETNYMLPSEKQLCLKFNVSREPVRKALAVLQQNNAIIKKQGKGTFINPDFLPEIASENRKILLALILPDISTPFLQNITLGIRKYCDETGNNYLLLPSFSSSETEQKNIRLAQKLNSDGILLMPVDGESYNDALLELIIKKTPCILLDRNLIGLNLPSVSSDHRKMGYEAAKYLLEKGYDKIAYFAQTDAITSVNERAQGYLQALHEHKNCEQLLVNLSGHDNETMHEQLEYFLKNHSDINGVIINSGIPEANLIKALHSIGRTIGEEIGMICFDDNNLLIDLCLNMKTRTIVQDSFQIGYVSATLLIEWIRSGKIPPTKTMIDIK